MSYIDNCKIHRQTIIDNFAPAECVTNVLSEDLLNKIQMYQFTKAYDVKWQNTSNNLQPICDIDEMFDHIPELDDVFKNLIGEYSTHHTGNFYITTQLHDAHADLLTADECAQDMFHWTNKMIPYKSAIIPLLISSKSFASTAFYKQRHIGHSITLDRVNISSQDNSMYEIAREYPNFHVYEKDYTGPDMYFPHIPEENNEGLDIETVCRFVPGDIMIFDSCQIHASCLSKNLEHYKFLKNGLNIQFYREV